MLLFVALSNIACLLLPALISASIPNPEDPVKVAAHHMKRLPTPLKNLLRKKDSILFAGTPSVPGGLALNLTNGEVAETKSFEDEITIPGVGRDMYFLIKGEIDLDYSVTLELWVHYLYDRRIGPFYGNLFQGVDLKSQSSLRIIKAEARLYIVRSGGYDILVFDAYGTVRIAPAKDFPLFSKPIKRWKTGELQSIQDIPNNSGVQTVSTEPSSDTRLSVE